MCPPRSLLASSQASQIKIAIFDSHWRSCKRKLDEMIADSEACLNPPFPEWVKNCSVRRLENVFNNVLADNNANLFNISFSTDEHGKMISDNYTSRGLYSYTLCNLYGCNFDILLFNKLARIFNARTAYIFRSRLRTFLMF